MRRVGSIVMQGAIRRVIILVMMGGERRNGIGLRS